MATQDNSSRQKLFAVITVSISILCGIALVEYLLGWYRDDVENSSQLDAGIMQYHPQLGWALSPNWQGRHQHHDFDVTYQTDANGVRQHPITQQPLGKTVAVLGDSFTFGFGVNDNETFTARLAQARPNLRFVNFGVPGYSTDQQFLQMGQQSLRQGKGLTVNHYLLVFYLGNDLLDNMLSHPLQAEPAKPYFELQGGNLMLKNVPVPRTPKPAALRTQSLTDVTFGDELDQHTTWFDSLSQRSAIVGWLYSPAARAEPAVIDDILERRLEQHKRLLLVLLKAMQEEATRQNASFTLAILPGSSFINAPGSYSFYFQDNLRKTLLAMAKRLDIDSIDLATALQQADRNDLFFPNERHLTVVGNQLVADLLRNALEQQGL